MRFKQKYLLSTLSILNKLLLFIFNLLGNASFIYWGFKNIQLLYAVWERKKSFKMYANDD